ncbi:MAG: hypothetical protein K9J81_01840 [Desulfohalobiaceae bacterium]|nr:hypothetical protein [Desulfohalobiaceae bacterium]
MVLRRRLITGFLVTGIAALFMFLPCQGLTQEDQAERPERQVNMAPEYPGVIIPLDEDEVSMDLVFANKGKSDEDLDVWIDEQPQGWEAAIKTYAYEISAIHVPEGEDKSLTFEAVPGDDVQPGSYRFVVKAETKDSRLQLTRAVTIRVLDEQTTDDGSQALALTTSYPVIRGPSDASFKFSVDVESKLEDDAVVHLTAEGPQGWEINFKPAYEDKYISSLRLKANQSKSVDVEVKPASSAAVGKHPIQIRLASGQAKAKADLSVVLTGTYDLKAGTRSGLLSLEARPGKPSNVSFYIKNTGTAPNKNISFMSFKPENWKVHFDPETITALKPGAMEQVEMTITPYEEALVGDYSVSVKIKGQKASENLEFRTTVKASAAWGWIGIGIIVIVILGLFGLFRWLGRR